MDNLIGGWLKIVGELERNYFLLTSSEEALWYTPTAEAKRKMEEEQFDNLADEYFGK